MERDKIIQMLKSPDWEMIELGIILFLQQPDEWCKTILPWHAYSYPVALLDESGHLVFHTDKSKGLYMLDEKKSKKAFEVPHPGRHLWGKDINPKLWIKDQKVVGFGLVSTFSLCYRSLALMKCRVDFDRIEKVYL